MKKITPSPLNLKLDQTFFGTDISWTNDVSLLSKLQRAK